MIEEKGPQDSAESLDNTKISDVLDEMNALMGWLQSAASTGSEIFDLFKLEVRLAVTDVKRLILLSKLLVPMLVLAWMSLSAVLAWHVYLLNISVSQGLLFLCCLQFLGLFGVTFGLKYYQKSLTLPLTRQHIRRFVEGQKRES